ncbi:hypothetical protein MBLNU230_g6294t1 [Neophaeotheca triangularis]
MPTLPLPTYHNVTTATNPKDPLVLHENDNDDIINLYTYNANPHPNPLRSHSNPTPPLAPSTNTPTNNLRPTNSSNSSNLTHPSPRSSLDSTHSRLSTNTTFSSSPSLHKYRTQHPTLSSPALPRQTLQHHRLALPGGAGSVENLNLPSVGSPLRPGRLQQGESVESMSGGVDVRKGEGKGGKKGKKRRGCAGSWCFWNA